MLRAAFGRLGYRAHLLQMQANLGVFCGKAKPCIAQPMCPNLLSGMGNHKMSAMLFSSFEEEKASGFVKRGTTDATGVISDSANSAGVISGTGSPTDVISGTASPTGVINDTTNPAGILNAATAEDSTQEKAFKLPTAHASIENPSSTLTSLDTIGEDVGQHDRNSKDNINSGSVTGFTSGDVKASPQGTRPQQPLGSSAPMGNQHPPNQPTKQHTSPEMQLPDKEQVERYFFRVVAFVYDLSYLTIMWTMKAIDLHIVKNEAVQKYWKKFHEKMEKAKKD